MNAEKVIAEAFANSELDCRDWEWAIRRQLAREIIGALYNDGWRVIRSKVEVAA